MALDGSEYRNGSTKPADQNVAGTAEGSSKTLPKGVVIGKDGKPCRSCTSFSQWAAQTKSSLKASSDSSSTATNKVTTAPSAVRTLPADCPPDVERLGNSTWTLLHTIAATYPEQPTARQKNDLRSFMDTFSRLYPCWVCADDFQEYMRKDQLKVDGRKEFGNWLCQAHNEVNRKLGKKEFDCSKWEERWRTGWKDGRCD